MEENKMQADGHVLISNLEHLHTTALGMERIKRNLGLDTDDVVLWCRDKIVEPGSHIARRGKNWYISTDCCEITVNAYSYTIITAHKRKK
jgi:hypothetical protein